MVKIGFAVGWVAIKRKLWEFPFVRFFYHHTHDQLHKGDGLWFFNLLMCSSKQFFSARGSKYLSFFLKEKYHV